MFLYVVVQIDLRYWHDVVEKLVIVLANFAQLVPTCCEPARPIPAPIVKKGLVSILQFFTRLLQGARGKHLFQSFDVSNCVMLSITLFVFWLT